MIVSSGCVCSDRFWGESTMALPARPALCATHRPRNEGLLQWACHHRYSWPMADVWPACVNAATCPVELEGPMSSAGRKPSQTWSERSH